VIVESPSVVTAEAAL